MDDDDTFTVPSEDPSKPTDPENPDKPVLYTAGIEVTKVAENGLYTVGDEITYTVKVKNTGNVAVKNIEVNDKKTGMKETISELSVGGEVTLTTS